jgi:hypothetical protein
MITYKLVFGDPQGSSDKGKGEKFGETRVRGKRLASHCKHSKPPEQSLEKLGKKRVGFGFVWQKRLVAWLFARATLPGVSDQAARLLAKISASAKKKRRFRRQ